MSKGIIGKFFHPWEVIVKKANTVFILLVALILIMTASCSVKKPVTAMSHKQMTPGQVVEAFWSYIALRTPEKSYDFMVEGFKQQVSREHYARIKLGDTYNQAVREIFEFKSKWDDESVAALVWGAVRLEVGEVTINGDEATVQLMISVPTDEVDENRIEEVKTVLDKLSAKGASYETKLNAVREWSKTLPYEPKEEAMKIPMNRENGTWRINLLK
jgi:hypothetical protein